MASKWGRMTPRRAVQCPPSCPRIQTHCPNPRTSVGTVRVNSFTEAIIIFDNIIIKDAILLVLSGRTA